MFKSCIYFVKLARIRKSPLLGSLECSRSISGHSELKHVLCCPKAGFITVCYLVFRPSLPPSPRQGCFYNRESWLLYAATYLHDWNPIINTSVKPEGQAHFNGFLKEVDFLELLIFILSCMHEQPLFYYRYLTQCTCYECEWKENNTKLILCLSLPNHSWFPSPVQCSLRAWLLFLPCCVRFHTNVAR